MFSLLGIALTTLCFWLGGFDFNERNQILSSWFIVSVGMVLIILRVVWVFEK